MKVLSAECYGAGTDIFELEIMQHLGRKDPAHPGFQYLSTLEDSFEHQGPNGSHMCLVFRVMAETLYTFRSWFEGNQIPNCVVQKFTKQLLQALDYAHSCGVIHTGKRSCVKCRKKANIPLDIKPDNIMIQVPDEAFILEYLENTPVETTSASPSETVIIPTQDLRDYYFPEGFNMMNLNIALSDWGVASWSNNHLTDLIQPVLLRAPEVLIEAPWGPEVDIWNLGALIPELLYAQRMFSGKSPSGEYSTKRHLEEMVKLFGQFPNNLLTKGNSSVVREVFNSSGNIKDPEVETVVGLERRFSGIQSRERVKFIAFIEALLKLDPEERGNAKELLDEPWLSHNYKEVEVDE
jgi:serine/threonine-protein kinase SRPK3